jgi:sulfite reductase (ferredoxin)
MNTKPQFQIPEPIKEDTDKYKGYVKRYLQGKLSAERFKGYRVPMGVYGQRMRRNI